MDLEKIINDLKKYKISGLNNNPGTVLVGLSGGVDSSVSAYLLRKAGFDVIGVTMKICDEKKYPNATKDACFNSNEKEDIDICNEVSKILNIPYHVIDLTKQYEKIILEYFTESYSKGLTPNPCLKCNSLIKFKLLPESAKTLGLDFDYFSTGHYVKLEISDIDNENKYILKKAKYLEKDQSYFLAMLDKNILKKVIFPLGDLTKSEVREIARIANLPTKDKKESMDFYGGDLSDLFSNTKLTGKILKKDGSEVGDHSGIFNYTIGKRKGLGQKTGEKLFVIDIDSNTKNVIVGKEEDLYSESLTVKNFNFLYGDDINPNEVYDIKIRSRGESFKGTVKIFEDKTLFVKFYSKVKAVTKGQYCVIYKDDIVIGGGEIY